VVFGHQRRGAHERANLGRTAIPPVVKRPGFYACLVSCDVAGTTRCFQFSSDEIERHTYAAPAGAVGSTGTATRPPPRVLRWLVTELGDGAAPDMAWDFYSYGEPPTLI